jgi:hypothetical protein
MNTLAEVFGGWNGYQTSLVNAVSPLSREQLICQPKSNLRSIGYMARHISLGRITWFARMPSPKMPASW